MYSYNPKALLVHARIRSTYIQTDPGLVVARGYTILFYIDSICALQLVHQSKWIWVARCGCWHHVLATRRSCVQTCSKMWRWGYLITLNGLLVWEWVVVCLCQLCDWLATSWGCSLFDSSQPLWKTTRRCGSCHSMLLIWQNYSQITLNHLSYLKCYLWSCNIIYKKCASIVRERGGRTEMQSS